MWTCIWQRLAGHVKLDMVTTRSLCEVVYGNGSFTMWSCIWQRLAGHVKLGMVTTRSLCEVVQNNDLPAMSSWTLLTTRLPRELLITTTRWAGQQLAHSVKLHTMTTRSQWGQMHVKNSRPFFWLLCCLTSTEAGWPIRDGDRVGKGPGWLARPRKPPEKDRRDRGPPPEQWKC